MRKLFKFILILFLLGFVYHLSALLVEFSFNLIGWDKHALMHASSALVSAIISFFCFKAITKKKPSEEREEE